ARRLGAPRERSSSHPDRSATRTGNGAPWRAYWMPCPAGSARSVDSKSRSPDCGGAGTSEPTPTPLPAHRATTVAGRPGPRRGRPAAVYLEAAPTGPGRPGGTAVGAGGSPSASSTTSSTAIAPDLSSGALPLPHLGDCTQDGQPARHSQSAIAARVAASHRPRTA